jgi:hypothetical protein
MTDDEYGINEDAEEKEPAELETTNESDDTKDSLDFLDMDSRILKFKASEECIREIYEDDWANDNHQKNVPNCRLYYERTGV